MIKSILAVVAAAVCAGAIAEFIPEPAARRCGRNGASRSVPRDEHLR